MSREQIDLLAIGDPHAKPDSSNERFSWLGNLIVDLRPKRILCIGDLFDFPSLSSYDKGKKSFEGRRYRKDLEAGHDALKRIQAPIDAYNDEQRKKAKLTRKTPELYEPIKDFCLGNHCNRLNRVIEEDPKLEGTIGLKDLRLEEFGWKVHPFLAPVYIEGILCQHYLTSGNMGRAIAGDNAAKTILAKYHTSAIVGHSHNLNTATAARHGKQMWAGSIGCFFTEKEHYVDESVQSNWWRGLVLLENIKDGCVGSVRLMGMEDIERKYGTPTPTHKSKPNPIYKAKTDSVQTVTMEVAAKILGIHVDTVRKRLQKNKLRGFKVNNKDGSGVGHWLVYKDQLAV
jgi:hypothetical protein